MPRDTMHSPEQEKGAEEPQTCIARGVCDWSLCDHGEVFHFQWGKQAGDKMTRLLSTMAVPASSFIF